MNKSTRRKFIGTVALSAMAGTAAMASNGQKNKQMKNIFIHHVYFWLKNTGSLPDRDKLVEGLTKLSAVKTIKQFHIGVPAKTNRDVIENDYAISWFVLFDNAADEASYQGDPIHLKFIDECKHLWEKVIVYDSVDAK